MKQCRLADVAAIDSGSGFPLQAQGTQGAQFPFLKVSDMNLAGNEREVWRWNHSITEEVRGKLRAKAFPADTLIFPKIGAAIGTNKKRQLTRPSCVDNNVMAVVPRVGLLEPDFLYFLFLAKNLSDFASASNPPSIRKSDVENWAIEVPSISAQRRIVDLLSHADGIVRLRREAEKKAAELIPALFLDMFGDPATNPKGWAVHRLGDIAEVVSGVTKGRKFGDKQTVEVPYLRVANVQAGHIDLTEIKTIEVLPREVEQLALRRGDLVLTEGGDFDKLGRGALWEHDVINCVHQNHVFRVRLTQSVALPEFFVIYLQASKARDYFLRCAKRTTNLASINMTQLRALPVVLPSMDVQREFVEHFNATRSIQSQQSAGTTKAQAAFNALLARCFAAPTVA